MRFIVATADGGYLGHAAQHRHIVRAPWVAISFATHAEAEAAAQRLLPAGVTTRVVEVSDA